MIALQSVISHLMATKCEGNVIVEKHNHIKANKPAHVQQQKHCVLLNNSLSAKLWLERNSTKRAFCLSSPIGFYHQLFIALRRIAGTIASQVVTCKSKRLPGVQEVILQGNSASFLELI